MHRLRGGSAERGVQLAETDGDMTSMYLKHGFISVCEARFDASTAGKPMAVEEDGKALRNVRYGPSCARTGKPMYFGRSPPVHYIEMELKGGTAPDPDFKGEMTEKGEWLDYKQDGTVACSIGVMASDDEQEEPRNFGVTTIPDDSFVWYRHGKALWWFDDLGSQPAFFNVPCSDFKDSLLLRSGDRIGVLVDFHGSRLGFVRNGELVQELKRDLNTVVPRYHLHFVVGAMRPNTTWTMVPAAQAWESLKAIDWDEWVEPPECDSVRPPPRHIRQTLRRLHSLVSACLAPHTDACHREAGAPPVRYTPCTTLHPAALGACQHEGLRPRIAGAEHGEVLAPRRLVGAV